MQEVCGTVALCNRGSYAGRLCYPWPFSSGVHKRASMQKDCGNITLCISINQELL